jgi:DNA-binding MarR family transcriptional regulator
LSIQSDIKQSKPFASKGEEAAVALMRTADMVRRSIGAVLDPHGLSVQQYNVLRILRGAGREGLPTLEIAQRAIEQAPGITRLVDTLEGKKLVSRARSADDRRCVYCRITRAGLALLARLDGPMMAAGDRAVHNVKPRQLAQLIASLDLVRESLNKEE